MKNILTKAVLVFIILFFLSSETTASEFGTNLVKNPSFEDGLNTSTNSPVGWSQPFWGGIGTLSTDSYSGTYGYMLIGKTSGWVGIYSDTIDVKENKTYFVRVRLKYENVKQSFINIEKFDSDNNDWLELKKSDGYDGSAGWKEYYNLVTIPKDIKKIRFVLNTGYVKDTNAGNATTWFDDIELIDPAVVNPVKYETNLTINKGESWQINNDFALFLEDATRESAAMSLIYRGYPLVSQIINKGEWTTFEYDKNKLLIFKLDNVYNSTGIGKAWLKEILAGSIPSEKIKAPKPEISVSSQEYAYMRENVALNVSVINRGEKAFSGDVEIIAKLGEKSLSSKENLNLSAGERKNFTFIAIAPEMPQEYKVNAILKTKWSSIRDEKKILIKVLNPAVTTLSPDLREDGGIRGIVTIGSAYPDALVDWNTNASIEIFRVLENGKERVYSKDLPVKSRSFEISIPYEGFYKDDGRYLVMIKAGEMKSERFFEIKGPDGEYKPTKGEVIPPTVVSNALYPQLMLLLIGMVAALTVRNHMFPRNWSLPLDLVAVGCGAVLFIAGMLQNMTELITKGMLLAGIGFVLLLAREHDPRINALLMRGSHIHDFIGLMLMFFSVSYIVLLKPEWNTIMIAGTLIVYYTLINLHGERKQE